MPELGDQPIEEEFIDKMNAVAAALDKLFNEERKPRRVGFILLVFPFGTAGRCNYISNGADRKDVVAMLKEQIKAFESDSL